MLAPHPHHQCRGLKLDRAIPLPALMVLVACYVENLYLYPSDLWQSQRYTLREHMVHRPRFAAWQYIFLFFNSSAQTLTDFYFKSLLPVCFFNASHVNKSVQLIFPQLAHKFTLRLWVCMRYMSVSIYCGISIVVIAAFNGTLGAGSISLMYHTLSSRYLPCCSRAHECGIYCSNT